MFILFQIVDQSVNVKKGEKMPQDKKDNKNIILVSVIIGTFLIFMLGIVIYTTSKVANCSSGKKLRKVCLLNVPTQSKHDYKYT